MSYAGPCAVTHDAKRQALLTIAVCLEDTHICEVRSYVWRSMLEGPVLNTGSVFQQLRITLDASEMYPCASPLTIPVTSTEGRGYALIRSGAASYAMFSILPVIKSAVPSHIMQQER